MTSLPGGPYIGIQTYTYAMNELLRFSLHSLSDEEAWRIATFRPVFKLMQQQEKQKLPPALLARARKRAVDHINSRITPESQRPLSVEDVFSDPDGLLADHAEEGMATWRIHTDNHALLELAHDLSHIPDDDDIIDELRTAAFHENALLALTHPQDDYAPFIFIIHSPYVGQGVVYPHAMLYGEEVAAPPLDFCWSNMFDQQEHLLHVESYILPLEIFFR